MTFVVAVSYYNDETSEKTTDFLFVFADTFKDATEKVTEYYGENQIDAIELQAFSPCDFLVFNEEDSDIFFDVKKAIGNKVIW